MTQLSEVAAHDVVRSGTYAEMAAPAVSLYDRLVYETTHAGEPVDFTGQLGLEVGGYDGPYRSVIGALGLERVVTIEPIAKALKKGRDSGIIPEEDAFEGTLQEWVAAGSPPADFAGVFNMMPALGGDRDFLRALSAAVKVGGLVATTFREPITAFDFSDLVRRTPSSGLRMLFDGLPRHNAPPLDGMRSRFLYLWRREEA